MLQNSLKMKPVDFEQLGHDTMLECRDAERTKLICVQYIHALVDEQQPELTRLHAEIAQNKTHGAAMHAHLYDRPVPVSDAAMLTYSVKVRVWLAFTVLAATACFMGSMTTFYLLGCGLFTTLVGAAGTTALPLVAGYFGYERIAEHRKLQSTVIAVAVVLSFAGLVVIGLGRGRMMDRATITTPAATSYVDSAQVDTPPDQDPTPGGDTETTMHHMLGVAMLLIMIAADIMLGFLVGLLMKIHTDLDYAAWRNLRKITNLINGLEVAVSELNSFVEIAKKHCTAGILRAQVVLAKRRPPYHRLPVFIFFILLGFASTAQAQSIDHYEGILIDTSGSISKGGTNGELFKQYLLSTKKLLLTEPADTRVWVSSIATDSFGGDGTVLKGWTPEAHGIFTDNLNRARRELAASFEKKASRLSPVGSGTDVFGALWRFKVLFESARKSGTAQKLPKTIWIFSDMVNETSNFAMPTLLGLGPERMMERAKANGLVVPLTGYRIYVNGATPNGLTPQAWVIVKTFWMMYFHAAGAELVAYSAECDVER
jgi:hypothetical protein